MLDIHKIVLNYGSRKSKDSVFTINLYHDGIFICNPLRYVEDDVKQITDVNFDGMNFNDLIEIVKRLVRGPVKSLYYCKVGSPLKSIKELKIDSDVDAFLLLGYENRMCVDLCVEHHDYDVLDFLLEETSDPELISASSDEYCFDDESEDIDGVDFHTEGDHNVVIKNFTTTDLLINRL
nr:splicing factor [Tanacetum cinerariifolium]